MSDAMNQHKKLAMTGKCYAKGGSIPGKPQKGPVNFGPPASGTLPPKSGFADSPVEKVKRVNGIKGV